MESTSATTADGTEKTASTTTTTPEAATEPISEGTTGFMFVSTALVQFMVPGLALFYAGLSGGKSAVQVMMQSFAPLGIIFLIWILVTFSIAFGEPWLVINGYGLLGDPTTYPFYTHVGIYGPLHRADSGHVVPGFPGILFATFQGMFAVITPALIGGAAVDRIRFGPYLVFVCVWSVLVYAPLGYWNWGGGWMFQIGAWDFAGGMVVHEAAGFSALGLLLFVGPRKFPDGKSAPKPHNLPMVMIGTSLLWFGWFGFNGGSALTIGGLATIAFINTQLAPCAAMLTWLVLDSIVQKKPTFTGACFGTITGLVVITPCAGFIQPPNACFAGIAGATLCYFAVWYTRHRSGLDDTCDTVGIHGLGGFLGSIFVGCLSDSEICLDRATAPTWCANPGTVTRSFHQLRIQTFCALFAALWSVGISYLLIRIIFMFTPLLADYEEQGFARDWLGHGENAYVHASRDDDTESESGGDCADELDHVDQ